MSATRSTQEERAYSFWRKNASSDVCVFCEIKKGSPGFIEETKFFKIMKNAFPYSIWDGQGVVDHLMIIPKKHTDTLNNLPDTVSLEYLNLLRHYESREYNIYARTPRSTTKSVEHQHTHLIKVDGRPKRLLFLLRWPFYLRASLK